MARSEWQRSIHSAHRWWKHWLPAMASFPPAMANFLPAMANFLPEMASFLPATANLLPVMANLPAMASFLLVMVMDFLPKHRLYPLS